LDLVGDIGVKSVKLPPRSPNLNAHAERFVRTIKESCLERMILFGEESLRTATHNFVAYYHTERNHQGLANRLISPAAGLLGNAGVVQRRPGIHRSRAAPYHRFGSNFYIARIRLFNDSGAFLGSVDYTPDSGAAYPVGVPEPSTLLLLITAILLTAYRLARRTDNTTPAGLVSTSAMVAVSQYVLAARSFAICNLLFAIHAEIVYKCGDCSIGIDRDMESLVYNEIIPCPLPDDAEIVYERGVEREANYIRIEVESGDARGLVFVTRHRTSAADPLRLKVTVERNVVGVHSHGHQHVQVSGQRHDFPCAACRTGDKHRNVDRETGVSHHGGVNRRANEKRDYQKLEFLMLHLLLLQSCAL